MVSARAGRGEGRSGSGSTADRLRLLKAMDGDQGAAEVLLGALQHAVSEIGGLGGMVHVAGPDASSATLMLLSSTGLPPALTRGWQDVPQRGPTAPARAFRRRAYTWIPPAGGSGPEPADPPVPGLPAAAGMAAVVLPGADDRPLGTLSVLTPAHREPDPAQRAFLGDVAAWVTGRLRSLTEREQGGLSPALLRDRRPAEAPQEATGTSGTWEYDPATGDMRIDARLLDALGMEDFDGRADSWFARFHPDDLPRAMMTIRRDEGRVISDHEWRVRRTDGDYSWVRVQSRPLPAAGGAPARSVGTMTVTTGTHEAALAAGLALRHMSDGFVSTRAGRIEYLNPSAEHLFGPFRDVVFQVLWEVPALRRMTRVAEKFRQAITHRKSAEFDLRAPGGRWYHARVQPTGDLMTVYLTDITDKRLREAGERAAAERAALVAALTRALAQAATAADVVTAIADTLLPSFGATGLTVLTLVNDRLELLGSAGYPPDLRDRLDGLALDTDNPAGQALHTGIPQFVASADEHAARWPAVADIPALSAKRAWAFLPLRVSGRPIGTTVISFDRPYFPSQDERTLLVAISGLIAQAVERASLFDASTTRARQLQNTLLPRTLPDLPAVETAARYLPSAQGAYIGGDWCEVISLSAFRVALVVGDVMGHGMPEAARMGQLRTAVHTLSDLELPPDEILAHINDLVDGLGDENFVTCLYGVYDPVARDFAYASAGHLPPAHVHPDGHVTFCAPPADPPLGGADPPFQTTTISVPDRSLLVLYTDGLVASSARRDIGEGMDRLARILHGRHAADLDPLCDTITTALLPSDRPISDDATFLVARTHSLVPEHIATWPLPEDPTAARQARRHVRDQLAAWGLGDELRTSTELIVSELVGNVIRHATGPLHLRLLRSDSLICEVIDGSLSTPRIRHPSFTDEGGRGLQLVAAMSRRWGARHTPQGKTIWAEQTLDGAAGDHGGG